MSHTNTETITTPETIVKRDGQSAAFDLERILSAIERAGESTGELTGAEAYLLARQVTVRLARRGASPHVEEIQDAVEHLLIDSGYIATARAYIVYREQHQRLRSDKHVMVDVADSINEYLDHSDWRINANANQGYSLGGLILNTSGKVIANYWLSQVYSPEIGQAHRDGDFHIHDLDMLSGYCAGWSLKSFLREGLNGIPGKVDAKAPKHLSSAIGQIVNFLGCLQNEWAGAQAFSSFDTYLAPFVRKDGLTFEQVHQAIQELVYNLNVPSRWGTQTPFTNLTFDWTCPDDLRDEAPIIAGAEMPFTYGDLQVEMDMINRAYIEVMTTGDASGRVFTFPIPTYNITPDFDWHGTNADALFEMTAKYGLPYFQNFVNSDLSPHMVRSMCCRLQLDLRELLKRGNGLFGSAEQTGSLGVVTVNMARLGYLHAGDESGLLLGLDRLLELAKDSLETKRKVIQRYIDEGLFPYTKRYLGTLRNHFSTIGVNGVNELVRNYSGDEYDITDPRGHALAIRILDHIRARMLEFQDATGHMYNLEATPAEGTTYRFAKEDKKRFPEIL
ncbi:MAG: ribonucleoside triphosphate reductase, partial [Propionibacteriaceae bacterium]|nr:ribonucleoside triphosphate reductase [Propionibacteriaceae bacterium]